MAFVIRGICARLTQGVCPDIGNLYIVDVTPYKVSYIIIAAEDKSIGRCLFC